MASDKERVVGCAGINRYLRKILAASQIYWLSPFNSFLDFAVNAEHVLLDLNQSAFTISRFASIALAFNKLFQFWAQDMLLLGRCSGLTEESFRPFQLARGVAFQWWTPANL